MFASEGLSQSTSSAARYNIKHTIVRTVAKQRMIMPFVSCVSGMFDTWRVFMRYTDMCYGAISLAIY